jgi:predicted nucleotidyltransferase
LPARKTSATLAREVLMPVHSPATLRRLIERTLSPDERVEIAYLFGSAAQGSHDEQSDVDVAVGFDEPSDALDRFRLLGELEDRLVRVLKRAVDVVDLYRAPPILQHQILSDGRPAAYCRDERRRLEFEAKSRKLYFEMKRRYAVYDRESFR